MASSNQKQSQDCINHAEWKSRSTKGVDEIPPLSTNPYCCSCKYCEAILKETKCWTQAKKEDINVNIKIGDRVVIQGAVCGVVKYIGDLDSNYTNGQVYIGVKLDEPVGEHDGVFQNKRFFECPNMHGVIVPIEDVNLLVPANSRSVPIKKPDRFLSMLEYADLKSLTRLQSESSSGSGSETVLQTMSESRLSTPLPEYHFEAHVTPPSAQTIFSNSKAQQEHCSVEIGKKCLRKSLDDSGVTRSGVFICDHSIAADISSSDPNSTVKERLLESLSHHCSVNKDVTLEEICPSDVDDKVEEVIVLPPEPTIKVPATPAPSAVAFAGLKKGFAQPPSASMQVLSNKPVTKLSMGGSKSVAADIKKHTVPHISKLATNKVTAPTSNFSVPTKSSGNIKKVPSKVEKPAEETTAAREVGSEQPSTDEIIQSEPVMPTLPIPPSSDQETVEKALIEPTLSYTSRLLSSLPREDAMSPRSGDVKLNDAKEFQRWAEKWGGGTKGWAKAQTLQKLKDAQRKGQKELEWQRKIDEIEKNEKYAPRVKTIRALREEILKVRAQKQTCNVEIQQARARINLSNMRREIRVLEAQTKSLHETNKVLLQKVLTHPLFDLIDEAIEFLASLEQEAAREEEEEFSEEEQEEQAQEGQNVATSVTVDNE